jgi:preprotein translocase subunit SecY
MVGSIFLVLIAILPILFSKFTTVSSSVTLGGTGLLIVVGVAIETYKQLESSLISRSYSRGRRRR